MVSEKELQELRSKTQCKDCADISLQSIHVALKSEAQKNNIPIEFHYDHVKADKLFGGSEECLVVSNPEHRKDYFLIAIRISRQGNCVFISADSFGTSKLMKAEATRKVVLDTAKVGWQRAGDIHKDYNIFNDAASGAAFLGAGIVGARSLII